jgi:shikimate dehydrogenase
VDADVVTKFIGLIGMPLGHSTSPVFQQAALDHCGVDAFYELWETESEELPVAVDRMREEDCLGANVTIPHKERIIALLDGLEPLAKRIGAVNTVVNRDGRLRGHNTDILGFGHALRRDGDFDPRGCSAVVLGAGGAARAVAVALIDGGAASLTVTDVDQKRAEALLRHLEAGRGETALRSVPPTGEELAAAASACQLLVNCTPIGMRHSPAEYDTPIAPELIPAGTLVFDLVANPPETRLLAEARLRGARTVSGMAMLVYQGAESFRLWTGLEPPLDVMRQAARSAVA